MNLPGTCWLDEDGKHVWWQHDCVDATGKRVEKRWMLPYPHWRNGGGESPAVTPSIVCTVPGCDFHSTPVIGKPPADWDPRPTRAALESTLSPLVEKNL